jgi:hypothetical protein
MLAQMKTYHINHREEIASYKKTWNSTYYPKVSDSLKNNRQIKKAIVINHYGGKCVYCGETNIDLLTLGHKNNDGAKHRLKVFGDKASAHLYDYLIREGFSNDGYELQIECYNHNCGKRRSWWDLPNAALTPLQRYRLKMALRCFEHYGNKCVHCGISNPTFLTIGHKNHDGSTHRKTLKSEVGGTHFYEYLVSHNFELPGYGLQLECFNCNLSKKQSVHNAIQAVSPQIPRTA